MQQLSAAILRICYSNKMEKSSPSRHSSCEQRFAESRLGRHAMDEMLILACLTPMKTGLHTNHVGRYTGSGCREDGSFAEHLHTFSLSKQVPYRSPVFLFSIFLCTSLPLFPYNFLLSLTNCSNLSLYFLSLFYIRTLKYARTAMLFEISERSS